MEDHFQLVINWAILCPGPSLVKRIWQHDPGGLIAVNGAIDICMPDWWALLDPEVFRACKKSAIRCFHYSKLWIFSNFENMGLHYINRGAAIPVWDDETHDIFKSWNAEIYSDLSSGVPFINELIWRDTTLFAAIALAIIKGGKNIRIYGADMAGQGYFEQGLENCRTRHNEKRWNYERKIFAEVVDLARRHSITIERISS
jgi:hypothetical protein